MNYSNNLQSAKQLDERDPLRKFRDEFVGTDSNLIYLNGNSLGRLPKKTKDVLKNVIENEWGDKLIRSWNEVWFNKAQKIGNKIATLIGARSGEVLVSDSTSVNLYKLILAALKANPNKTKIVSDVFNFPSDLYIIQGIIDQFPTKYKLELISSSDGISIDFDDVKNVIDKNTALVLLSHVAFKSGFLYDMEKTTIFAHEQGAMILWDLSHSVGAIPIDLNKCGVDFAVGCTYKYLNGGPGSPAFLYVNKDLIEKCDSPIWGWFGEKSPFEFNLNYKPSESINKFLVGTPQVLSLSAIEPAVEILVDAGIEEIRKKNLGLSDLFVRLVKEELDGFGFQIVSPLEKNKRGSHISISHNEAYRITKAMIDESIKDFSVIADFRDPDIIRFGFSALYNSFEEIYRTVEKIKFIVAENLYANYSIERNNVT
ncbi:MAG: kynureninase [Melioribacteraceae bacterium]|nr:kynureninase [Melioribacteraceae bacterium]MCF8263023.1 kynureninase [Melioribacteraceae bacterium]MCF8430468.1 kynureninase [Melioribacteraceae bacterium]